MKQFRNGKLWIKVAVLLVLGTGAAVYIHQGQAVPMSVMIADLLFTQASVVLIYGVWQLLMNLHMFTSFSYSFRNLHRLMRGNLMKSGEMKDDYLKYRETRRHYDEAPAILTIGAVMLVLSVVMSLAV